MNKIVYSAYNYMMLAFTQPSHRCDSGVSVLSTHTPLFFLLIHSKTHYYLSEVNKVGMPSLLPALSRAKRRVPVPSPPSSMACSVL